MKKGIHPGLYKAKVTCACGEVFETISTREELRVELCSKCHPYFTGRKKIIDTAGRVDKLRKRYEGSTGQYQFAGGKQTDAEDEEETEETK
jgi:large subunit ribosomal protein L31